MSTNAQFKFLEEKLDRLHNYEERLITAREQAVGQSNYGVLQELVNDFGAYKTEVLKCFSDLKALIKQANDKTDQLESYSRKNCLIVHGIVEHKDENVVSVLLNFLKEQLLLELDRSTIDNCHRLNTVSGSKNPRPIIIKFTTYLVRSKVWFGKKCLKGTNFFISESLTRIRLSLYKRAREMFGSKYTWTIDGRIIVLFPNGKKRTVVTEDELTDAESELKLQKERRVGSDRDLHAQGEGARRKQIVYNTRGATK